MLSQELSSNLTDAYMGSTYFRNPRDRLVHDVERTVVRRYAAALAPGSLVVDVPSGNGRLARCVAERGDLELVVMDFSHNMLVSMEKLHDGGMLARRVQASVFQLPLRAGCVDLLLNIRLMHHLPDRESRVRMLREVGRVTRGRIITSYWTTHSVRYLRKRLRGKPTKLYPISPREFRSVCDEAGLTVEKSWPVKRWREKQCLVVCRSQAWSNSGDSAS